MLEYDTAEGAYFYLVISWIVMFFCGDTTMAITLSKLILWLN